jgi:hypothetical protein
MLASSRIITPMIGVVYFREPPYNGSLPPQQEQLLKGKRPDVNLLGTAGAHEWGGWVCFCYFLEAT